MRPAGKVLALGFATLVESDHAQRHKPQRKTQAQKNATHREGVAKRLKRIEAMVEDLPAVIAAVLADRQTEERKEQRR
jgi:hypothetical protein